MPNLFDLSKLDESGLENFRLITDPLADDTVAAILSSGKEKDINRVFMKLVKTSSFEKGQFAELGPDLSEVLDQYFVTSGRLPDWANDQKIRKAERVFTDFGPEIFMLLNVSSLPMCYTCAKGAWVLYDTGRLMVHEGNVDPLARRLMETAQMIVNVMSSGGLSPNGSGIITIQKVRLIHACIRYYLLNGKFKDQTWDVDRFGKPINQEDLAGTLMSFSPVILTGLKHLNINLSESEIEAYSHCWKVVGHLMGIQPELLPETYDEGMGLASRILAHQADSSEAGKALTNSCIKFINYIIPGNAFDYIPGYLIDFFLKDFSKRSGKDLSACIGLKVTPDHKDRIVLAITRYVTGELGNLEEHKFIQKITQLFNRLLLRGIIYHFNGGKGVHFFLPPSLQNDWGLTDEWEDFLSSPSLLGTRLSLQKKKEIITKPTA